MAEATGVGEQLRMSPTVHYERDAREFYLQAVKALKTGDNEVLRGLIPKIFPVRPLIPDTKSIYHGVMPYVTAGEPGGATFLRRSQGMLMSPKEYVEALQRIQEDGLKSPDRDQLFSDRNIRGLYFVDRPEVTWGLLYVEAPLSVEYPYAYIQTKEDPKPVFKGIMIGMTFLHGDEFIVYSYTDTPLRGIFKAGIKSPKDVHEKLPPGYYKELQAEFRKAFAGDPVGGSPPEAPQREQVQAEHETQAEEEPAQAREQRERVERMRRDEELADLRLRLAQAQHSLGRQTTKVLEQQANIRELERQLLEAKKRATGGEANIKGHIPSEWYSVLDVEPSATPDIVTRRYREMQEIFHPDRVLAALEKADISRDNPVYKALQEFANNRTSAINNAYREAKRLGKASNGK